MLATPGGLQANARSQTHFYAIEVMKLLVRSFITSRCRPSRSSSGSVPGMHCSTCAPTVQTRASQTRFHARQEVKLRVSGMHCSACSTAVEAALGALPGVRAAAVSLTMQQADVVRAPGGASEVGLVAP